MLNTISFNFGVDLGEAAQAVGTSFTAALRHAVFQTAAASLTLDNWRRRRCRCSASSSVTTSCTTALLVSLELARFRAGVAGL